MTSPSSDPADREGEGPEAVRPRKPARPGARQKPVKAKAARPKAVPAKPKVAPAKPVAVPAKPKAVPVKPKAGAAGPKPAPARPGRGVAAPAAGPNDERIGKTIGRCRIESLVGVGRTARVYRAHYEALEDTVAVKILRGESAENAQLVKRFQTEARAIAQVDNENVPRIYDVGKSDGLHYMVVEFLEGEEILDLIGREGQVEVMDALRIVRQAANGLSAAHALGLVHRDVKPQNLVLLEDGTVKVVDFGLAARFDKTSERVGTPHYMAPEVCESGNAEFASDIYGLGIVLYHLLVGQPPYAGKDIQGILRSHMAGEPLRPERHRQGLQPEIGDLVRRLTKRDPLLRPSAVELIEELDEIGGKALRQKETLRRRRHRGRARSAVARRARASKRAPAVAAMALAIGVIGLVIFLVAGGDGGETPTNSESAPAGTGGGEVMARGNEVNPTVEPVPEVPRISAAELAARAAKAAIAEREKEAEEALERATQYARDTWVSKADNDAVRSRYLAVLRKYPRTPAADEAKRRAAGIKAGTLHPHPDKEWSSEEAIRAAREGWTRSRPILEQHIAEHAYKEARGLLPPEISEASGTLTREIDFWRQHVDLLLEFQRELATAVSKLPEDERLLQTPAGEGRVRRVTDEKFELTVGTQMRAYAWKDVPAASIAALAQTALAEKGARGLFLQLAFAFAHDLRRTYWDIQLEMGATPGAEAFSREQKDYTTRMEARAR